MCLITVVKKILTFIYISACLFRLKSAFLITDNANNDRKQYAIYVWREGFDSTIPGCNEETFMKWNKHDSRCFTHNWNTERVRNWLWSTCKVKGREISTIYLADIYNKLKPAFLAKDCGTSDLDLIRTTLSEGHTRVANLTIYGLFAASDQDVSERYMVPYVVWYNDHCTNSSRQRFDGVAVNNEAFTQIKCGSDVVRTSYLDKLQEIQNEAAKQKNGKLYTHYSVSWNWGLCQNKLDDIHWHNSIKPAPWHMIDIFDSIDVQVAYTTYPQISDRMFHAGYNYSVSLNKPIYTELYTTKDSPCQISFFPEYCRGHIFSETDMFNRYDRMEDFGIGYARPCIHAFREIYSSGGHHLWQIH